jgi:hypothetical protein
MMKLIALIFFLQLIFSCSSLEKERLALEKEKLELEKKKLQFQEEKLKACACCNPCSNCGKAEEVVVVEKKEKPDCIKEPPPTSEEIWALSVEGNWHYSPSKIKSKNICKGDIKESFYKQFTNTESYVAKEQVPATKQSSCINNVLFRSFYYECKPTDQGMRWDSCKCVLYASYPEGKQGLAARMKK